LYRLYREELFVTSKLLCINEEAAYVVWDFFLSLWKRAAYLHTTVRHNA
jgi:hypothetical protein